MFGDAAYPVASHVTRGALPARATLAEQHHNLAMSRARISVEWGFGGVVSTWAFVDMRRNQKLGLSPLGNVYVVAILLQNFRTCCNGNQTSEYFGLPPQLEDYVALLLQ